MIPLVFLVLCVYYILVCFSNENVAKPTGHPPDSEPYTYSLTPDGALETSVGSWKIPQHPDYYFSVDEFLKKDECFQKPDDFKVHTSGKRLYDFIHRLQLQNSSLKSKVTKLTKRGKQFFFNCRGGRVKDLHVCDAGDTFEMGRCVAINPCTDRRDGETFADDLDRRNYYRCHRGQQVRKRCPSHLLFIGGICTFPDKCDVSYGIDKTTYIRCREGVPVLSKCPAGTRFFSDSTLCESNMCDGSEDGVIPMRSTKLGPFSFAEGHVECKEGRVVRSKTCHDFYEKYLTQEQLYHIPTVFDGKTCSIPSFCENIFSDDPETIVPVHEFTKYAARWPQWKAFDEAVGYRCENGKKTRVAVRPANVIRSYREVSACDGNVERVIVGDKIDRYYDCTTGTEIMCPIGTSFNGIDCQEKTISGHRIKGVEILQYGGLSRVNGWMIPPTYANEEVPECVPPETECIEGYNVCADPECAKYPFLKQVLFRISTYDHRYACVFKAGKIVKKKMYVKSKTRINYWRQKFLSTNQFEDCVPGQKTASGIFQMDAVLYATCNFEKPFVFCPSPHTKKIIKNSVGDYVCEPEDCVYEGIVPVNKTISFNTTELASYVPSAAYFADGVRHEYDGSTVTVNPVKGASLELSSEQDIRVNFRQLITYHLNNYFDNKVLKDFRDNYVMKEKGSTKKPLNVVNHHTKQV